MVLFLVSIGMQAQVNSNQSVPCGKLELEIVADPYTGGTDDQTYYSCCGYTNCQRVRYSVYLKNPTSGLLSGNFNMLYTDLTVNVKLTGAVISAINELQTESLSCLNSSFTLDGGLKDFISFNATAKTAELGVINSLAENQTLLLPSQQYRTVEPLFTVFVD